MAKAPTSAPDYSAPIDITAELGVQLTQRKQPNLRDHVPSRFIPREEAVARGWSRYWSGESCRYGHQASHAVANVHECSDCVRERDGQSPIYPRSKAGTHYEKPRRPAKDSAPIVMAPAPLAPEPVPSDKAFLAKYAEHRDLEKAAAAVGSTAALIAGRRSHNKLLDDAMTKLEADLTIPRLVPAATDFEWSNEKRTRLLEVFIDSGNLSVARDAIKCTPSQLWRELDANPTFAGQLDDARIRAAQVFEERAHAEALNGNDRLLPIVLKAERPDKYTEKLRVDLNTKTDRMTDEQISTAVLAALGKLGLTLTPTGNTYDAEIVEPVQLSAPKADDDDDEGGNSGNEDLK